MAEFLKKIQSGEWEPDAFPLFWTGVRVVAGLFLLLLAMIIYAPALGDTRFIFGTDTVSHDYVMHYYGWVKSVDGRGELPLWNPYLFSGTPMLASAALCPFYPSQWLYAILPFNTGFTLQYILAVAIGGIGAAWWMRCIGHRRLIAFWAGILYMVSGHFLTLTHAGHLQKMIALAWAPVALGATYQIVRYSHPDARKSSRYKAAALLGLALGMQLLASHPQIFYGTAFACVLQLLGMAIASIRLKQKQTDEKPADTGSPFKVLTPIGRAFGMSILALIICAAVSAVQLFPTLEMAGLSNRADGVAFTEAVETSYPPLEIFEYAIPSIFGDSVRHSIMPYFGAWGERIVSDYIGIPVIFLALVGFFGSKRRYRWFLAIVLVVSLVIAFGRYTPIYWVLYHVVPGFDSFRSPGTFMFLTNCAIIGLATFGLDYLYNLAESVNDRGWDSSFNDAVETDAPDEASHSAFGPTTAAAASAPPIDDTQPYTVTEGDVSSGLETPPANPQLEYEDQEETPGLYYYPEVGDSRVASSNFTWDSDSTPWLGRPVMLLFIAALALASLVGAIIALNENWGVNLKVATDAERLGYHTFACIANAAIAIMCVLGAILLLRLRAWIGTAALGVVALAFPLAHNYHFIQFEPLTPYMAHLTRQADLLNLQQRATQPIRLLEENALKNEPMLYSISSVAGYHPVISGSYAMAAHSLGLDSDAFGGLFMVNYARTFSDQPPALGSWVPDPDASAPSTNSHIWMRENIEPYVRPASDVIVLNTDDASLTSMSLQVLGSPGGRAYEARVSESDALQYRLVEGIQQIDANLQQWLPHEVHLRTSGRAARDGAGILLPVSDPWFPGWKAETSRGRPLPVIAVNGLQRGVVVPPGEHNIRFIFKPYSFRFGLFVSLVSVTMLAFFAMGTLARRIIKSQKKVKKAIKRAQTGRQQTIESSVEGGA